VDKPSCIAREPLSRLADSGSAAILNYNLPQSTTYDVVSFLRLDIAERLFKAEQLKPPPGNYWSRLDEARGKLELTPEQINDVLAGRRYLEVPEIMNLGLNLTAEELPLSSGVKFKAANIPVSTRSAPFATTVLAHRIAEGERPFLYRRPSGKQGVAFQPRPKKARPAIYLVLKMRLSSYLGDYGAGQTVSTFSLLPGEKTTIQIRDYRHREATRSSSESVLDSYSESAMEDLQTTIEESSTVSEESSGTATAGGGSGGHMEGGINLFGFNLGFRHESESSGGNTLSEALSEQVNTLERAVSHQVQTADTQRQIEIQTDVSTSEASETEKTVTRTLENINRSRVLNFVFRQLLQEYLTLTWLDDVSLLYSNDYDTSVKTAPLSSMQGLLRSVLVDAKAVEKVIDDIHVHLSNVRDHTGERVGFIERVTEQHVNALDPGRGDKRVSFVRKRRGLEQTWRGKTVAGIILGTQTSVVRTPALIVDAVLGQGEALDCYNQHLQAAAVEGAHLANRKLEQAIGVVEGIAEPAEKAHLYNHVFGTCCPSAQAAGPAEPAEPAGG
jgi:hypothetical protein